MPLRCSWLPSIAPAALSTAALSCQQGCIEVKYNWGPDVSPAGRCPDQVFGLEMSPDVKSQWCQAKDYPTTRPVTVFPIPQRKTKFLYPRYPVGLGALGVASDLQQLIQSSVVLLDHAAEGWYNPSRMKPCFFTGAYRRWDAQKRRFSSHSLDLTVLSPPCPARARPSDLRACRLAEVLALTSRTALPRHTHCCKTAGSMLILHSCDCASAMLLQHTNVAPAIRGPTDPACSQLPAALPIEMHHACCLPTLITSTVLTG